MDGHAQIKVLFIAGFGPIVREEAASRALYVRALGLSLKEERDGYLHTESLKGAKSFGLWPIAEAARSCFGRDAWPGDVPIPQAWIEFDVEDVAAATTTLASLGYRMLVKNRKEPWGQTVSRFIGPDGLLVGISETPSLREES
jgi:catechol 2,3-dioxygenase-like lactoylglutathione lyase family enzyme